MSNIEKTVQDALTLSSTIVINSNDDETYAVEFCKVIKNAQKMVGDEFDKGVEDAHALHKTLVAQRSKYLDPLKEAESKVKSLIKSYRLELELKRQEEQRKAQAILDAQLKAEQEKLMKEAEIAKSKGNDEQADTLAVQAILMESGGVIVESKEVKQQGMSSSIVWKARVTDIQMLPMKFWIITANQKMIDEHVKLNGMAHPLTGVEYYQDVNLSIRR